MWLELEPQLLPNCSSGNRNWAQEGTVVAQCVGVRGQGRGGYQAGALQNGPQRPIIPLCHHTGTTWNQQWAHSRAQGNVLEFTTMQRSTCSQRSRHEGGNTETHRHTYVCTYVCTCTELQCTYTRVHSCTVYIYWMHTMHV